MVLTHVNIVDVFLHGNNLLFKKLLVSSCFLASLLFLHKSILGVGQLNLKSSNGGGGLRLLVVVLRHVALLLFKLGHQSFFLHFDQLILFKQAVLCLQLFVILAPGCTWDFLSLMDNMVCHLLTESSKLHFSDGLPDTFLPTGLGLQELQLFSRVWQANEPTSLLDDDKPAPVSHLHVLAELPLGNLDKLTLIVLLSVNVSADSLEGLALNHPDQFDDLR